MQKQNHWIRTYMLIAACFLLIAYGGDRTVTVIAEITPIGRKHCFIIDPGHGGEDGGATSCTGQLESMYNLEIAQRLNDLLSLLGYNTKMTRSEDISIYTKGETLSQKKRSDLQERVRIVNETEGAILLSIHQNIFTSSSSSGSQVFYSEAPGSKALAEKLQDALIVNLSHKSNRSVKKGSGIYLMEHISCPGVLIECGFISNPEENSKLGNPVYQKKLCCIIAATAGQYISNS